MNKIFTILLLFSQIALSQNFTLQGRIFNSQTSEPIEKAFVFISYSYFDYSNNEGFFSINLPRGKYNIKISMLGYKTLETSVSIDSENLIQNFYLEPSPIQLDNVIVTTDRNISLLRNSTYSKSIISESDIQEKPVISLPEIMKNQPGISIVRDGIWGSEINIRGLSRENVVTLIDGNRIVTSTDISARLAMIDMNDIERIEIIKGASSSIYGSGATGGIVNIISKSPKYYEKFSFNGKFASEYNSVNKLSVVSTNLYGGNSFITGKFSGSFRKADNTKTPKGILKNSQFEDFSISSSLNIIPFDNHKIKFDYQLFKAEDVGIPGSSLFPNQADVRYPEEKRQLISVGYDLQNLSEVIYKISLKYSNQYIRRKVENIPYTIQNVAATPTTPARRISVLKIEPEADHYNNNLQFHTNLFFAERINLITGIDYWDRKYNGFRQRFQKIEVLNASGNVTSTTNRIIAEKPLPDSKMKSLGLFVQSDTYIIDNKLFLMSGFRFDLINIEGKETLNPLYEINNGVLNPKPAGQKILWRERNAVDNSYSGNLGFRYSFNQNLDLTLGLSYAFRSPSLEERFQFIDLGSFVRVGNPDLKSELSKSVDFGARYYSNHLKIISSIFYNKFENLVSELPGKFDGRDARIKTNIGEARLYGFDFRTEYNFYSDYVTYVNLAYVKGDDLTAKSDLPQIPPLNGMIGYKMGLFDIVQIDINSTLFAEQNKVAAGELKTPGYAIFNLYLNTNPFSLFNTKLRFFAGVENILDKAYRDHLSSTRGLIKLEPGRNIFVKVAVDF
ncbi:MAG: TonB-dependent receptor [Ignavibacterium sp.]|nr:TonB-dependent receptor [Ignavibacterium sp.]